MGKKSIFYLKRVFNWQFMPYRYHHFLFGSCTKSVETISGLGLLGFAFVFWLDGSRLVQYPIYIKFQHAPLWLIIALFGVVGLAQVVALWWDSARSNIISGYLLIMAAMLWFMTGVAFGSGYPPANTGMVFPPLMAVACTLVGHNVVCRAKSQV